MNRGPQDSDIHPPTKIEERMYFLTWICLYRNTDVGGGGGGLRRALSNVIGKWGEGRPGGKSLLLVGRGRCKNGESSIQLSAAASELSISPYLKQRT